MTIRVEREALLRVISRAPSTPSSLSFPAKGPLIEEEFVVVELPDSKSFFYDDLIPGLTEEDDTLSTDSVTTVSTTDDEDEREQERPRVSFAPDLITDVWTREKTPVEHVSQLYYSSQETQQFRQEYRLERKVLNELSIDPETFPGDEDELSSLVAAATGSPTSVVNTTSSSGHSNYNINLCSPSAASNRHRISRVVVLHNDKLETFFNECDNQAEKGDGDFLTSLISPTKEYHQQQAAAAAAATPESPDMFFDNDSFWSGSLTWY